MKNFWQTVFSWIFTVYFFSVGIFVLYFNWTYARENGFTKWLLLGEVVATAKAVAWPYFVFSSTSETNHETPDARHFINSKKAYDEALLIVDKAGDVTKLPDAQKTEFAGFVKLSIVEAKKVQPEYLQEAHPDYYKMYETRYISGMDLMLQGIEANNMALILEGAIKCNEFSDWLHEHKREFKH